MATFMMRFKVIGGSFRSYVYRQTYNNLRLCSTVNEINEEIDRLTYVKRDADFKPGKKTAAKRLVQLLNIKLVDAMKIMDEHKVLWEIAGKLISDNYKLCKENGIADETILRSVLLLSERNLLQKIRVLQQVKVDLNKVASLLLLPSTRLVQFALSCSDASENVITVLSEILQVPELDICDRIVKKKYFLLKSDATKVRKKCELLQEVGVTREEIFNDLWVLNYSDETIKERVDFAKAHGIEKYKTWMTRVHKYIFMRYIQRKTENKTVLGDNSLVEYLSQRLDCTAYEAQGIVNKHPAIKNKSMKKMQELIDFLYAQGFKPIHICRIPKILFHSVNTIEERLKELNSKGVELDSLYILTKSQKQYVKVIESLPKNKKKSQQISIN